MRKIIKKKFFSWNFDKEEKWLNEMASKGLALISAGFFTYEFEDSAPGEYQICLQKLDNRTGYEENRKYIEFVESMNAEHVGTVAGWAYFRRRSSEGKFELFSDNDSKVRHLTSVIRFFALIMCINLYIGLFNIYLCLSYSMVMNLIAGSVSLLLAALMTFELIRLIKKRRFYKDSSILFE